MGPMAVAGIAKGLGKVAGLFSKKKTTVKDIPLSKRISSGLDKSEMNLAGDMERNRAETDRAYGEWGNLMPRLKGQLGRDLGTIDQYRAGGPQERRSMSAIGRYGDSLRAANRDALDATQRRSSHQQAMMGSGGAMSPFMAAQLMGQQGAMNRGVASRIGGMELANMNRFQGYDLGNIGRGAGLMSAYGQQQARPLGMLMMGDQANRNMYAGAIANRRGSMDRLIGSKMNAAGKISNALGGTGDAMQEHMLSSAYMNKLDPSGNANSWSNFGFGGGKTPVASDPGESLYG